MSNTTIFYILGIALVLSALTVAAFGLRKEDFPSKNTMRVILPLFAVLVVATMTFAVRNSQSEIDKTQANREKAQALDKANLEKGADAADNPDSTTTTAATTPAAPTSSVPSGPVDKLAISSPATGELQYNPDTLNAKAGAVEIDYDNPSTTPHSVAIADATGTVLDQSQPGAQQTFKVTAQLKPGNYVFYCTVPGHRQAGMSGKLIVK
jgi:plastocyanin